LTRAKATNHGGPNETVIARIPFAVDSH
jgi:hypothetical protein